MFGENRDVDDNEAAVVHRGPDATDGSAVDFDDPMAILAESLRVVRLVGPELKIKEGLPLRLVPAGERELFASRGRIQSSQERLVVRARGA